MSGLVKDAKGFVAIVISRNDPKGSHAVDYIVLQNKGFDLYTDTEVDFDKRWKDVGDTDWSTERMAALFRDYSQVIGASKEAIEALSQLCKITPEEMRKAVACPRLGAAQGIPREDHNLPQLTDLAALRRAALAAASAPIVEVSPTGAWDGPTDKLAALRAKLKK
jgi:hypothetical protein